MTTETCLDCENWIINYCELLDDTDDTYEDFDIEEICEYFKKVK